MKVNKRWRNNVPYVTREQRVGIFVLSLIIVVLQLAYFFYVNRKHKDIVDGAFDAGWMREQLVLDSLRIARQNEKVIYPFNPNYISDYKGYTLGMTLEEIDKLHVFRGKNNYVNSATEFQNITGVSDEWLDSVSVYFKFPDRKANFRANNSGALMNLDSEISVLKDINLATQEDLMEIRGVGVVFSERIISERDQLNGFINIKQLDFIWGLSKESIVNLKKKFDVLEQRDVNKINVNTATLEEISKIPYINYQTARSIIIYRSNNGDFKVPEEFENIRNFPLDKLEIISLYLAF